MAVNKNTLHADASFLDLYTFALKETGFTTLQLYPSTNQSRWNLQVCLSRLIL